MRLACLLCSALVGVNMSDPTPADGWAFGPFVKQDAFNPCLVPDSRAEFVCPIRNAPVKWEGKDVFNPAAVVRAGKVYLLYRAEDNVGRHAGTSRIGLAESADGLTFTRHPQPVLYPDNDSMKAHEWEGGCEDPRVVEDEHGTYYMTYTAYDGRTGRLCVATSKDLLHWTKQGPAFGKAHGGRYVDLWSKSGAIVCRQAGGGLAAARINGTYWMYWGDTSIFLAHSDNLIDWTPVESTSTPGGATDPMPKPIIEPRRGKFDSALVEPGPPAVVTKDGIVLIYNSKNADDPSLPLGTYAAGQALLDPADPSRVLKRTDSYFLKPEREYELGGQVNNVCFLEGLVHFRGTWYLYYGTADSKIAVAAWTPAAR